MAVAALFKFIAKNPPSLLIAGGILLIIVGFLGSPISPTMGEDLINWGKLVTIIGVALQVLWMFWIFAMRR